MNRTLKEDQIKEFFNNNTTISILNELKSDISEELFKSFNNHIISLTQEIVKRDQYKYFNRYNSTLADEIDKI